MSKPNKFEKEYYSKLIGHTIRNITWGSIDGQHVPILVLDDDHEVQVLADPEGNGPGHLQHRL